MRREQIVRQLIFQRFSAFAPPEYILGPQTDECADELTDG